jgi:hypothetical protein
VAIDSTRIAANASRNRIDTEQALRNARARIRRDIRRWQKQCDTDDPNEGAGSEVGGGRCASGSETWRPWMRMKIPAE